MRIKKHMDTKTVIIIVLITDVLALIVLLIIKNNPAAPKAKTQSIFIEMMEISLRVCGS